MYLGTSALFDFFLSVGLGIAASACVGIAVVASSVVYSASMNGRVRNTIRVAVFLLGAGALLSIASFLGSTKSMRDGDSVLGFPMGVMAFVLVALLIRRFTAFGSGTPR